MTRPIEVNDIVSLEFRDNTETGFKVLHIPQDVGDMWYLESPMGEILAVNNLFTDLYAIKLEEKGGE